MMYGLARASYGFDTDHVEQTKLLLEHGCLEENIYREPELLKNDQRPIMEEMFGKLKAGDTVVVTSLDRIARYQSELFSLFHRFEEMDVTLISLTEDVRTTDPVHITDFVDALSEFAKVTKRHNRQTGLRRAHSLGLSGGRPCVLEPELLEPYASAFLSKEMGAAEIAEELGVSRPTFYKYWRQYEEQYIRGDHRNLAEFKPRTLPIDSKKLL